MAKWDGYQRFCSLARGLDLIGERWTLPVIQELLFEPARYNELRRRLPGIGSNVLSDRLRKLEHHGIVTRTEDEVGQGVMYGLTERGKALDVALRELRIWGLGEQLMLDPDSSPEATYDMRYAAPPDPDAELRETYLWLVDDIAMTLKVDGTEMTQQAGSTKNPAVTVRTSREWVTRLVAGDTDWIQGRENGDVQVTGNEDAWRRMLIATHQPGRELELPPAA